MPFPAPPRGPEAQETGAQEENGSGQGGGDVSHGVVVAGIVRTVITGNGIVLMALKNAIVKVIYIKGNGIFITGG